MLCDFLGVKFPVDWQIRRSVDIDVILVDDNIDRQMSINNKVSRSRYMISLLQVVIVDVSRVITHINTYLV